MTYYCLPPMLHELAFVGVQAGFFFVFFKNLVTELAYNIVGDL